MIINSSRRICDNKMTPSGKADKMAPFPSDYFLPS